MPPRSRVKRKTKNTKTKTTKRKITKAQNKVEEKKPEKIDPSEPTQIIFYNGEPILVPISKIPKSKSGWKKFARYLKNIAIAGITLGALGYGAYKSKNFYDGYLKGPVNFGGKILKSGWDVVSGVGGAVSNAWDSGNTFTEKLTNTGGLITNKINKWSDSIMDAITLKKNWGAVVADIRKNKSAILHNEKNVYFMLTVLNKCYLYDNNNKCAMRDSNGVPINYDINLSEKIYDSQGRLVYDKNNSRFVSLKI